MVIEMALDEAMATRRNDRLNAFIGKVVEDGVGVVRLIGTEPVWLQVSKQWQRLRTVAGFAAGEVESGKRPQSFHERVNLCAQSATRSPERLVPFFLGAPAAC